MADDQELDRKFAAILRCLDERQRQLLAAGERSYRPELDLFRPAWTRRCGPGKCVLRCR